VTLVLREVEDADLPMLYAHQADPVGAEMAAFPSRDAEAFLLHWAKIRVDPANTTRTIVVDGEVVGNVASFIIEGNREVGYWIGREHWGRGYATAALTAFLAIDERRPLYAACAEHNVGSARVLEHCGFTYVGPEPDHMRGYRLDG
jgi:RimJ/RimL family protein N-acetyltransferase